MMRDAYVRARVPPVGREWDEHYAAVPYDVLDHTIETLQALIAQWTPPEGIEPQDDARNRVMAATCYALAGLVWAHAAHDRQLGIRELVKQIDDTLSIEWIRGPLVTLRQVTEYPDIVDALITLYDHHQRRACERTLREQRDRSPGRGPAPP